MKKAKAVHSQRLKLFVLSLAASLFVSAPLYASEFAPDNSEISLITGLNENLLGSVESVNLLAGLANSIKGTSGNGMANAQLFNAPWFADDACNLFEEGVDAQLIVSLKGMERTKKRHSQGHDFFSYPKDEESVQDSDQDSDDDDDQDIESPQDELVADKSGIDDYQIQENAREAREDSSVVALLKNLELLALGGLLCLARIPLRPVAIPLPGKRPGLKLRPAPKRTVRFTQEYLATVSDEPIGRPTARGTVDRKEDGLLVAGLRTDG